VKLFLLIILSFYVPQLFAQVDTITISNLPIASEEDEQMCFDSGTGKLGKCSAAATAKAQRTALVSKLGGGDYNDPIAAMDDLSSWCSGPSLYNRCQLRIAPGDYDLGSNTLFMVEGVDIKGAGMYATRLRGSVSSSIHGLINGAKSSVLSDLTVWNSGTGSFSATVAANNVTGFYMDRVYIRGAGSASFTNGLRAQVALGTSGGTHVTINDSLIIVHTTGNATNVRVVSEVADVSSTVEIKNSELFTAFSSDTSLQVTTVIDGAKATVILTYSEVRSIKRTGSGISNLIIRWSDFDILTESAAFGTSTCAFVVRNSTALTDTCS
jgi:hypothetical protein